MRYKYVRIKSRFWSELPNILNVQRWKHESMGGRGRRGENGAVGGGGARLLQ